ncbi:MAG: oligosaccharide flippase family protein [Methylomarinum sp.]|nr:oligosaccharide flippase family protein [Methylomarinum sp.]
MNFKRSFIFSSINNYSGIAINLISSVIIARLLKPEEIGIFSVAISLVGFAHLIRNFGIGEYLIQEKNLTTNKIRSAFTLNISLGWTLAIIIYFCRHSVANFYHEPGIAQVFEIIAINFLLIPFGANSISLLRRNMRFDQLMLIDLMSAIVGASTGIICALEGMSYLSLAWAAIAGTCTTILGALLYSPKEFTLRPGFSEIKAVIHYGSFSSLTQILHHLSATAPDIILGKLQDMHTVGIFSRATGAINIISMLLVNGIRPILLPYFAKENRNKEQLNLNYLRLVSLATVIIWPITILVFFLSPAIIHILYGDQWLEAIPVLKILALEGFFWPFILFAEDILKATGNVKKIAKMELILSPLRFLMIIFVAKYGLIYVAFASLASGFIKLIFFISSLKTLNIRPTSQAIIILKNIIYISPYAVILYISNEYMFYNSDISKITYTIVISLLSFIATSILFRNNLYLEVINQFRKK